VAHDLVEVLPGAGLVPRGRGTTALEHPQRLLGLAQAEANEAEGNGPRSALAQEAS